MAKTIKNFNIDEHSIMSFTMIYCTLGHEVLHFNFRNLFYCLMHVQQYYFSAYNYDSRNYDDEYDDYAPKSNYQPYGGGSGKKLNSYMKFLNTR